ncbi:NHLP bacteriocin system secretion protein [Massilia sp. W12]|uniref:NHLP bacteriocin system secretion protein n=1 Tax=Massilia sp. W12 TaxID=3126507 RepID=UPI0030D160F6
MSSEIFRKVALERLSTPDQLDQALLLTPAKSRLALWLAGLLVLAMLVASLLISVPVMASGSGIVLQTLGVSDVVAAHGGRVRRVLSAPGQTIQAGQLIAELSQPELETALQTQHADLREAQAQRARISELHASDRAMQSRQQIQQRGELQVRRGAASQRHAWLQQRIKQDQQLLASGFLSRNRLQDTEAELLQQQEKLAEIESNLKALDSDAAAREHVRVKELLEQDLRISNLQHRIREAEQRLQRESRLLAEAGGVVAEIKFAVGDVLSAGQAVLTLLPPVSSQSGQLEVIAYLAAGEGKKVKPGMAVRVTPGNVKKEEFGSIIGTVQSVAPIPATSEGMQRTLRNRQLVQNLSQNAAPIEVRLSLQADPASASGLRWTSRGPDLRLDAGTIVQAEVVVKRIRLLALALPALEAWLHLEPIA